MKHFGVPRPYCKGVENFAMAVDLQTINQIAEELSFEEHKRLLYLCGDLDIERRAEDVRGMLMSLIIRGAVGPEFLLELLTKMRRFDIMKRVLRTNKREAEELLGSGCFVSEYRVLIADISEDMSEDDLRSVIFLLGYSLPKERLESVKTFLDVVVELEKLGMVSCEKVDLIEQCLRDIRRVDLARKVQGYQERVTGPQHQSSTMVSSQIGEKCQREVPSLAVTSCTQAPRTSFQESRKPTAPENIKIAVPETGRQCSQGSLDTYRMRSETRGVCVIINCVGSDGDMLEETFAHLRFRVIHHKWLSGSESFHALRELSQRQQEHQGADAFVCCLLGRATSNALLGPEEWGQGLHFDTVRHLFTGGACPRLAGKPKLFFIQGYNIPEAQVFHGHRDEDLEADVPVAAPHHAAPCHEPETVPCDADIFWSHCQTDAKVLERSGHSSMYLRSLVNALVDGQRRRIHLLDVHTEVNAAIYTHNQRSQEETYSLSLRHTLRQKVFI